MTAGYVAVVFGRQKDVDLKLIWMSLHSAQGTLIKVPWAPDYVVQGKNGLEKVMPRVAMPVVALTYCIMVHSGNVLHGAN